MVEINEKKYDRQLRLWGNHGQARLQNAHVCLINATATGTEILKNLVLPGIGAFTIVDGEAVSGVDAGNNFFLLQDNIGQSRAKCAKELLLELNNDVIGHHCDEDILSIISNQPKFFEKFTLVIGVNMKANVVEEIAPILWALNVPLVLARSYGMVGYLRVVAPIHTIVEGHVDETEDFRCDIPFGALSDMVNQLNLEGMSNEEHRDVPYLLIIMYYLRKWKESHNGQEPKTRDDKEAFKKILKDARREAITEGEEVIDEENFEEAHKFAYYAWKKTTVPSNVKDVFEDRHCDELTSQSDSFWFLARAIREFTHTHSYLPLKGKLPDMSASTKQYTQLLQIYQEEAQRNITTVTEIVGKLLSDCGMPNDTISEAEMKLFCKNATTMRCFRGTSIEDEKTRKDDFFLYPEEPFYYYLLFRAVDVFEKKLRRFPGTEIKDHQSDFLQLKECVSEIQSTMGSTRQVPDSYIQEMCRFGAGELHTVAACIGGLGSQEITKLLTKQFNPLHNTLIVDSITAGGIAIQI